MICPFCGSVLALHTTTLDLVTAPPSPPPPAPPPVTVAVDDVAFTYVGTWAVGVGPAAKYQGADHYSNTTGSSFEVDFTGTQIALFSATAPWHGIASAAIDGGTAVDIDLYSSARIDQAPVWTSPTLAIGPHKLVVTVAGRKNAAATDYYITGDKAVITGILTAPPPPPPPGPAAFKVSVVGNKLVNGAGTPIQLRGMNRMGTEYACIQGNGIFEGPATQATVDALKTWKVNVMRIPMNEDCWLAINGSPAAYSGNPYQQAIKDYVALLVAAGIYVILDLHWTAPGTAMASGQDRMASADHSPAFWTGVATAFKGNDAVIFDLFNEPQGITWAQWKNGDATYAGMQTLVNAIRSTGATNVIMLGGIDWATNLTGWLANKPIDPLNKLVAAWHVYNFNVVNTVTQFDTQIAPVAVQVPVVVGEFGADGCNPGFLNSVMTWCDTHAVSYVAWSWNPAGADCANQPIIKDWNGTPWSYGQPIHDHYVSFP